MGTERLLKMSDLSRFQEYLKLADQLSSHASKEDLAECARLLAFNVAHYEAKYAQLPLEEPNRYNEPKGYQLYGIRYQNITIPTRIQQWTIEYRSASDPKRD